MSIERDKRIVTGDVEQSDAALPFVLKSRTESELTYRLKWVAWRWLYTVAGCRSIGMEVKLEGPFGRIVDLVGVGKNNLVYIVEVKSTRSDLRRDDNSDQDRHQAIEKLSTLQDAANLTATVLQDSRKHAISAAGDGADWRDDPAYKSALRDDETMAKRIEAAENTISRLSTKFHDPRFLACADFHYIMCPKGLISRAELPPFWGLLNDDMELVAPAVQKQIRRNTLHVLRSISKSNTRDLMKACGIKITRPPQQES